jgi:Arc/MetJ-type ribon-helix-helix transcriptional regulator
MRLIAVHLPERYISDLQALIDKNLYPNRSEVIRIAIRDLLKRELWEHGTIGRKETSEAIGQ